MRRYSLYIAALSYTFGIVIQYYVHPIVAVAALILGIVLTLHTSVFKVSTTLILVLSCIAVGCVRVALFQLFETDHYLDDGIGKEISCDGIVIDQVQIKGEKLFTIVLHEHSRIYFSASAYIPVTYGDEIICTGVLKRTDKNNLIKDQTFYELSAKTLEVIGHHRASRLLEMLYGIRAWFVKKLYDIFPSPHGELIAGLTVEGADAISKELKDEFKRTSLSHIVALSGTNVSIIVEAVFIVLRKFRRSIRFTAGFGFIIVFALMTGLTSTILRASLMAMMSLAAELFHRTYNPLRCLCIASLLMVLVNPLILLFDISFQLSFMATLSMVLIVPALEIVLVRFISYEIVRETLVTTLSAQILVAPLIMYYSGSFSLIAPISNVLVLPCIPWAMLFGSLSVFASYFGPVVFIVSTPAQFVVSYILYIVHVLSLLPFAAYVLKIPIYGLVFLYALIGLGLFFLLKKLGVKPDY